MSDEDKKECCKNPDNIERINWDIEGPADQCTVCGDWWFI